MLEQKRSEADDMRLKLFFLILSLLDAIAAEDFVPKLEILQRSYSVAEGESFEVTVRKTGYHLKDIYAVLYFKEDEAAKDFRGASFVLHFGQKDSLLEDEVTKTFFVEADDKPEGRETYHLSLRLLPGSGLATLGPDATITIEANDDAFGVLGFETNHVELKEGQTRQIVISRGHRGAVGRVSAQILVSKVVVDGLRPKPLGGEFGDIEDIRLSSTSVTFFDQQRQAIIEVTADNDKIPEDEEIYVLKLITLTNGARSNASSDEVQIKIPANDAPIRFLKPSYSVEEGNTSLEIVVTRGQMHDPETGQARKVGPLSTRIQVPYKVYSTSIDCKPDRDFVSIASLITFEPGVLEQKVSVHILDDDIPESAEQFIIELGTPMDDAVVTTPHRSIVRSN